MIESIEESSSESSDSQQTSTPSPHPHPYLHFQEDGQTATLIHRLSSSHDKRLLANEQYNDEIQFSDEDVVSKRYHLSLIHPPALTHSLSLSLTLSYLTNHFLMEYEQFFFSEQNCISVLSDLFCILFVSGKKISSQLQK
jgi:hypothetical protein